MAGSNDSVHKKRFGANQQISVASILAILIGVLAVGTGYFPETNTYSLLAGGTAVLLSARATLYALAGSVFARGLPVLALFFSLAAMLFCLGWPYISEDVTDRVTQWWNATQTAQPAPSRTDSETKQNASTDAVQDEKRLKDTETYRIIKEAAGKSENDTAVKPPKAPE